jgi:hypothetical protein
MSLAIVQQVQVKASVEAGIELVHEKPVSNARHHPPASPTGIDERRHVAGRVHAVVSSQFVTEDCCKQTTNARPARRSTHPRTACRPDSLRPNTPGNSHPGVASAARH